MPAATDKAKYDKDVLKEKTITGKKVLSYINYNSRNYGLQESLGDISIGRNIINLTIGGQNEYKLKQLQPK